MQVPLLDLRLQYASIREDVLSAVTRGCDSQQFILGSEVEQLESEIAAAIGVPHAIAVSSGTDALLVALMALGIGEGDEVIIPTFSFFATAGSVSRVGATPVFVDIDPVTLMLDVERVRAAMTSKTKAIIPVHLYGLCADMTALTAAADGIHIIEDAVQATKNLGGFGDGGLVTTTDERLAALYHLTGRGIGTEVYYPVPFHRQPCFAHLGYSSDTFPNAEAAAGDVLALPMYPELTSDQQQHVIDSLAECVA